MPTVDYYLAPQSPYTYLGHARFQRIVADTDCAVRLRPMDLGRVFPASGGLPLQQRAPQRQAYRLVELRRFAEWLGLPLNLHPKHFPVDGTAASCLILATDNAEGSGIAMSLVAALTGAVWAEERDIASDDVLAGILATLDLPASLLAASKEAAVREQYDACTQQAIDAGVFGAPSYVVDGEVYWGQDRLDFVERRLRAARGA